MIRILIGSGELGLRQTLRIRLSQQGRMVVTADHAADLLRLLQLIEPHLVILDDELKPDNGLQLLSLLRTRSEIPIILINHRDDIAERITALELGADDVLVKPFSARELDARIRAVLRRPTRSSDKPSGSDAATVPSPVVLGDLQLDVRRRQAFRGEDRIRLTELEFRLLEVLLERAGDTISRVELLQRVWDVDPASVSLRRIVDSTISRLRAKLELNPDDPELILTTRGLGYRFRRLTGPPEPEDLAAWRARLWGLPEQNP